MLFFLSDYKVIFGPLRLFEYVTFRAAGAAITALLLTLLLGPLTVKLLKKFNASAPNRYEQLLPEEYQNHEKDKTPSMGGLLIIFAIATSALLWTNLINPLALLCFLTLVSLGILGFIDDYIKVAHRDRNGVAGRIKLIVQFGIAIGVVWYLSTLPETGKFMHQLMVPLMKNPITSSGWVMALSVLVIVGSSNAVNLTDGKDGLAPGCSIFCVLAYGIMAYLCGHIKFASYLSIPYISGISEVVVFSSAVAGACTGFLWYNCSPASMFMGDTGSLALGGIIGLIAVLVRQELILAIIGGVFVMEAGSVVLQVLSYKLFKRRIFRCAPIHHHFEYKGWPESQIVIRFWILAGIFAVIGLATLKLR